MITPRLRGALGLAVVVAFASSGCGIINVHNGKSGLSSLGSGSNAPSTATGRAMEVKEEQDELAKLDCSKVVPAKKGLDPMIPHDAPCAVKTHAKLYVDVICSLGPIDDKGKGGVLLPGMEVEAIGLDDKDQ